MDFTRNARSVLITATLASLMALVYYLALFFLLDEWRYLVVGGATLLLLLAAIGGFSRLRAGRPGAAIWPLILGGDLSFIVPAFVFANASLLFAPAIILLVVLISLLVYPDRRERNRAIYSALGSALVNLLADQVWPFARAPLSTSLSVGIGGLMVAVTLAYALFFFRSFRDRTLRATTTALIATLVILTVTLVSGLHILYTRATLLQNAQNSLYNAAENTANAVENLILSRLTIVRADAQNPILPEFLAFSPHDPDYLHEVEEITGVLLSYKNREPIFISSYALLDVNGRVLASTEPEEIGRNESERDYFQRPLQDGLPFFSVWFAENSLYFSAPVRDENHAIVGILRARYSASLLQQTIIRSRGLAGEGSFAVLFDEHHLILAHGLYVETIFKSLVPLDAALLAEWQKEGRYPRGEPTAFTINLPEAEQGLNQAERKPFFILTDVRGIRQQAAALRLKQLPWMLVFAQPQQVFLAPINRQISRSILLAIGATILAAYLAIGLSRLLTNPMLRLTETARQIAAGDLLRQAVAASHDEIGDLAQAFNEMTARLRDLIANLEQRVAERTRDLELRSAYLQGTAEVGRAIAATLDPQTLMQQAVDLIQERFGLYYVGLFELDGSGEWANLRAGTGQAGRAMLARGHRIRVGAGMIGWSIANNRPRIAQQAELDEVRLRIPELPDTRSEAALPLRARGQILGAISIQSERPNFFNDDNLAIFQILADQIAIAMENARLFDESQTALASLEHLYTEQAYQQWRQVQERIRHPLAFRSDGRGVLSVSPLADEEARRALESGGVVIQMDSTAPGGNYRLNIPIKVRGVPIGLLRTYKPAEQGEWTSEEINTLTAACERIGLAIESARLFQEAQLRALKERAIGEIRSHIGTTVNLRDLLQIAVEEIGHTFAGSDVTVQFDLEEK